MEALFLDETNTSLIALIGFVSRKWAIRHDNTSLFLSLRDLGTVNARRFAGAVDKICFTPRRSSIGLPLVLTQSCLCLRANHSLVLQPTAFVRASPILTGPQ